MNPNEINKLKEKAPIPIFLLLILFFLPTFFLEPEQDSLKSLISAYDNDLKKARAQLIARTDYSLKSEKLELLEKSLNKLREMIPSDDRLPGFINSLQGLAKKNSVSLEEVNYTFQKDFEKLDIPSYMIMMNLSADYSQIKEFLNDVEALPFPLVISDLLLNKGSNYVMKMRLLVK